MVILLNSANVTFDKNPHKKINCCNLVSIYSNLIYIFLEHEINLSVSSFRFPLECSLPASTSRAEL